MADKMCSDCGCPVERAEWTLSKQSGLETQINQFDQAGVGLGRFVLTPRSGRLPYARHAGPFSGTHNLHACLARRDQEPERPGEPWHDEDAEELRERLDWRNTPDPAEMGY